MHSNNIPVVGQAEAGVNVDVQKRTVTFFQRRPLDIRPTEITMPFSALLATAAQVIAYDAQQEAGGGIKTTVAAGGQAKGQPA